MFKKILMTMLLIVTTTSVSASVISCNFFNKDQVDRLLNFRQIDYNDTNNIEMARKMQNDVSLFRQEYLNVIQDDWKAKFSEYELKLKNKEKIDSKQLQRPISVKSKLHNGVYLAQQPFGAYYPRVSELQEINGYEISNWSYLEEIGFSLYVNNSNDQKLEIINSDIEDVFIDENNQKFTRLNNINKTDEVFFRSTKNINKTDFGTSVKLKFIAIKKVNENEVEILQTPPNAWGNTSIDVSITNSDPENGGIDFIVYKLGEWLNYEYIRNSNLIAFQLTSFILAYIEIIGNFMYLLDKLERGEKAVEPINLIKGFSNINNGKYGGDTPADFLYYGYKFNSAFSMFTIILDNHINTISMTIDQNMPLNVKVEDDLSKETNNKENRTMLDFNPMFEFDQRIIDFNSFTWKLLLKLDKRQCDEIRGHNATSTKCDESLQKKW